MHHQRPEINGHFLVVFLRVEENNVLHEYQIKGSRSQTNDFNHNWFHLNANVRYKSL